MLRIKKNVDLKELEKFGFEFEAKGWFNIPNIIYDLIQSGIVEKMEE